MHPKKGVREFYNKTAGERAERWYSDDSQLPLLREFMRCLPVRPRVLDLCCGVGYDSGRLRGLGAEVVGLDLSEDSLAIARERNPEIEFYAGDMLDDYSHLGKVDGIFCSAGLVHLTAEQLHTAFERMSQVTDAGALVLLHVRAGEGRVDAMSDVTIDGVEYDRAFYAHSLAELRTSSGGLFEFVREIYASEMLIRTDYLFQRI